MGNKLDVDWSSRGSGPVCQLCGHNQQVMKATVRYTPKLKIPGLRHSHIPIRTPQTATAWYCHNHEVDNIVGPA